MEAKNLERKQHFAVLPLGGKPAATMAPPPPQPAPVQRIPAPAPQPGAEYQDAACAGAVVGLVFALLFFVFQQPEILLNFLNPFSIFSLAGLKNFGIFYLTALAFVAVGAASGAAREYLNNLQTKEL